MLASVAVSPADAATLRAPALQVPANGASVLSLPAFTWGSVRGASQYDFEFAADRGFASGVSGFGNAGTRISSTAITGDKQIPDGTYYWRVRAVNAQDHAGAWSSPRVLHKAWNTPPRLTSPLGSTINWPNSPLVLRWSPVPYATDYYVWIATDPALSNLVIGSVSSPQDTHGTVFAFPTSLAPGRYYWAITAVDAEGDRGPRSAVSSFVWNWPSATNVTLKNIATSPGVFDPQFSWNPVPGATGYQVEVNSAQDFPVGSKWCCDTQITGTSLSPTTLLANGTYYWRVRAIDVRGDAGVWNVGPSFTQSFDELDPTIPNLQLRDIHNNMAPLAPGSSTDTPIITWDPVPGASLYEAQLTPYAPLGAVHCDWTSNLLQTTTTASTAWTPLGKAGHLGPGAWPWPQVEGVGSGQYCFRILAKRDKDTQYHDVITQWTQLASGFDEPAFNFTGAPTSSGTLAQTAASDYLAPADGSTIPRTPLFTWKPVAGANGYYVVVSRDRYFTNVVDVGFTNVPAYAPQLGNKAPYADETTAYWWAVVPSSAADGSGVNSDPGAGEDAPRSFNKSSVPPTLRGPANGSSPGIQPTLSWTSAENAMNYRLQVSADPSFSNPLLDTTTDSTAYTTNQTLPADTTLYWRVRANDTSNQGLNWSSVGWFTHRLPVPVPYAGNPTSGHAIPLVTWAAVPGAVSYDLHVDQADGTTRDFNLNAPAFTPTLFYGTGIWRWQVRADFPGNNGASSAYFTPESRFVRTIPPPSGVHATKSGMRVLISWAPDPDAKQYTVALSTTDGFSSNASSDQTDNTVWAPQIDAATAAQTLYWRVAAIDQGGNTGAYATGVFHRPKRCVKHRKRRCVRWR
jgi:hypothetical protein